MTKAILLHSSRPHDSHIYCFCLDAAKLNTLSNSKSTANNSVGELVTGEKRKREEDRLATSTGPSLQQALKTFKQSKSQEKNENNKGKSPNKSLNPSDQPESSSKLNKKVAFVDNSTATSSAATLPVGDYNTNTTSQQSQEAADYYNYYYNYSMPSFPTPTPTSMATSSTPTTISSTMIDEALQNMLTAWYQSGYATARYQTLCELGGYGLAYATEDSTKQPSVEKDQTGTNP